MACRTLRWEGAGRRCSFIRSMSLLRWLSRDPNANPGPDAPHASSTHEWVHPGGQSWKYRKLAPSLDGTASLGSGGDACHQQVYTMASVRSATRRVAAGGSDAVALTVFEEPHSHDRLIHSPRIASLACVVPHFHGFQAHLCGRAERESGYHVHRETSRAEIEHPCYSWQ